MGAAQRPGEVVERYHVRTGIPAAARCFFASRTR
jgi:hypothetical protein